MATMWCPSCRSEYREGFSVCADCGATLVATLAPLPKRTHANPALHGPFLPGDDVVELTTTNAAEARVIAARLESLGIAAAVFGDEGFSAYGVVTDFTQGCRVMVRRRDIDEAAKILAATT